MCPMTMTAGFVGLLASLPLVGGLFAFLPKLGIGRLTAPAQTGAGAAETGETTAEPAKTEAPSERTRVLELELLQSRREIRELREQLAWQTRLAGAQGVGIAQGAAADAPERVTAR